MKLAMLGCVMAALLLPSAEEGGVNLLSNPNFEQLDEQGRPKGWTLYADGQTVAVDPAEHPDAIASSLSVKIAKAAADMGSVSQKIKDLPPNVKLVLTGYVKATHPDMARLQVKLKAQGKEISRLNSDPAGTQWGQLRIEFDTQTADELSVQCRFSQSEKAAGQTVWITGMKLSARE